MSAVGAALGLPRSAPGPLRVGFAPAFAAVVMSSAIAFAHSYTALAPLLGSESPDSLLLLVPFAATFVLWRQLADASRDGAELTVNVFLATPLLVVLLALLLWFPARLSFFYWVYRLDLLAVPLYVALAVLLCFGATALWRARWAVALLVLGWPPVLDALIGHIAEPLSTMQAAVLHLLPLPAAQVGTTFLIVHAGHREALTIAAPCAGLLGIFSMLFAGGLVVTFRSGSRRRKLAWLATATAIALLANVVRLALVVVAASRAGVSEGFVIFHALAGPLLFAVTFICALQLLGPFGLVATHEHRPRPRPLELERGALAVVAGLVLALGAVAAWTTEAIPTAGLFHDTVVLAANEPLPLPVGFRDSGSTQLASLGALFGGGAHAELAHIRGARGDAVAAQVVLTDSYRAARRYNVLDCFVFHHAHVYATHVAPLAGGGTAVLIALRIDRDDIATLTWIQPALVDGRRAWRRVLLFAYLDGVTNGKPAAGPGVERFSSWLLDRLSPYGATSPPPRFRRVERGLVGLADGLVAPGVAGV